MSARLAHAAKRWNARNLHGTRVERGLPHHPDGSGFAPCPDCEGGGEVVAHDAHGHGPECEYPVTCGRCVGAGEVRDGHVDPILLMRQARQDRCKWGAAGAMHYGRALVRAYSPVCLPQDVAAVVRWSIAA